MDSSQVFWLLRLLLCIPQWSLFHLSVGGHVHLARHSLISVIDMTLQEQRLITELSTHIPVMLLSSNQGTLRPQAHYSPYSRRPSLQGLHGVSSSDVLRGAKLASLRPHSAHALRTCLLRSPEALASLRLEAAERFMRWREVERAVGHVLGGSSPPSERDPSFGVAGAPRSPTTPREDSERKRRRHGHTNATAAHAAQRWNKTRWEEEWEGGLATDVAKTLRVRRRQGLDRRTTVTAAPRAPLRFSSVCSEEGGVERVGSPSAAVAETTTPHAAYFDPLHLPSLLAFSFSLLGPLKSRIARAFSPRPNAAAVAGLNQQDDAGQSEYANSVGLSWVLIGAFCAGLGMGVLLSRTL